MYIYFFSDPIQNYASCRTFDELSLHTYFLLSLKDSHLRIQLILLTKQMKYIQKLKHILKFMCFLLKNILGLEERNQSLGYRTHLCE